MVERIFHLEKMGTNVRTEFLAGITTFLTMAYIIFVNPIVLSTDFRGNPTGLAAESVMLATCLAAFLGTCLMGLVANYPIAQAPGMGENFFFVSVVMTLTAAGFSDSWKVALGIIFLSGVLFLILTLFRVREALIDAISPSLKNGIAVGIGLFIAFIGLRNAGVVLEAPGTAVRLNPHITEPRVLIFFAGLIITAVLHARKVRGAILWGILISTGIALVSGQQGWEGVVGLPRQQAFFQFDFSWMRRPETYFTILPYVLIFLFMNVFDTVGTLIGVSEQAGFLVDNKLPRASQALLSDAVATVAGACMGTSTVTSYIESAVGVASGGRTGLTSIVTGGLFIVALFFTPLAKMVGGYPSITAPALLIVGGMMVRNLEKVDWEDYTEALPAFLIILGVPLFYSISDGLAVGFISYPLIKLLSGKGKGISPVVYVIAILFIARYVFFPV